MKVLELTPAPHEVAVARVPAGIAVRVTGGPLIAADERGPVVAVPGAGLGWGAAWCSFYSPSGVTRYRHARDRDVWQQAASMLAAAGSLPAVLYLVHEQRDEHGKTVWVAVRIRQEDEQ